MSAYKHLPFLSLLAPMLYLNTTHTLSSSSLTVLPPYLLFLPCPVTPAFFHLSLTISLVLVIVVCPILSFLSSAVNEIEFFFLSVFVCLFVDKLCLSVVCWSCGQWLCRPSALFFFFLKSRSVRSSLYCCHCCLSRMGRKG